MRTTGRRLGCAVAALTLVLAAAACGDDDDSAESGETGTAASGAAGTTADSPNEGGADQPGATTPGDGATGATSSGDAAEVDRDASFAFAYTAGHTSFDPHRTPSAGDQIYQRPVYDRLLTIGRDDSGVVTLEPQLATSYEFADDGLSITFELRDDVTFQDGTPFNADAVKANIERAMGPESTVSSLIPAVEGVEVVDDDTVVFELSRPDAGVPWALASSTTGMMASPAAFDSDLTTTPVGSGPFQLVSARRDAEVVYERWDGHWNPDAALVKELTIQTVPDLNARYNSVQADEVDMAYLATPVDAEAEALESEGYHRDVSVSPVVNGLLMNSDLEPFDDARVRRAVSMAFDRTQISEELLNGINPPAYQPITEGFFGYNPDVDDDPYDPEAAKALVQEAGAEGATIELIQSTTAPYDSIALIAQQALGEIGLNVELVPISPTEARTVWREGNHEGAIFGIIGQLEPSLTLANSYLGVDNPASPPQELVDMAASAAAMLPPGGPEQEQAYQEIEAYLVENPVHAPLLNFTTTLLARPDVVGIEKAVVTGIAEFDMRGIGKAPS